MVHNVFDIEWLMPLVYNVGDFTRTHWVCAQLRAPRNRLKSLCVSCADRALSAMTDLLPRL